MREYHEQRIATESQINAALSQLNQDQQIRLKQHLGSPPSLENVPDSFWKEVEEEHAALLFLLIASISSRSARYSRNRFESTGLHVPDDEIDKRVAEYAANRAANVAAGTVEGMKNRLTSYFDDLEKKARKRVEQEEKQRESADRPGKLDSEEADQDRERRRREVTNRINEARPSIDDVDDDELGNAFSGGSYESLSRTETTAAVSNGEGVIVGDAKQQGKEVEVIWRIDPMSRVCAECRSYNGKTEDVWSKAHPDGPPAHPYCACDLEVRIEGISAGSFLPDVGLNPVGKMWVPKIWKPKLWLPA